MNPFARLFSSLANAVLDLGLPTIRGWLRERLGDAADVADVSTDGSLVRLRGVRIPIGPRGLVVLDAAAATITSLGEAGPALRLHSFEGVLVFGSPEAPAFRADITFVPGDDPDNDAWIWGDVAIQNATWAGSAADGASALNGFARLFVSSKEWKVEGGRLDGTHVVAKFAATGSLETSTVMTAALALERGRVGPFLDAAAALTGATLGLPAYLPRDAQLDGEVSFGSDEGARAAVTLAASGLAAKLEGTCAADGSALVAKVDGTVGAAALLARLDASPAALPRSEDSAAVAAKLAGSIQAPTAQIEVRAPALGFRFGRPRFVPCALLRDGRAMLAYADGTLTGAARLYARSSAIDVDVLVKDGKPHASIRADGLEPAFLRDVACALGSTAAIPESAEGKLALHYDGVLAGTIELATEKSRLVAQLGTPTRVTGGVDAEDIVALGVLASAAVFPSKGHIVVAIDVDAELRARGSLASAGALALTVNRRPDMPPYVVTNAHADIAIDASGIAYEDVRFDGYGGRFAGYGSSSKAPYIVVKLTDGGLALADALLLLVPPPRPSLRLPADVAWTGTLTYGQDLAVDLNIVTKRGTNLDAAVRLHDGDLTGSTAKGAVAVEDLLGTTGWEVPLAPEGLVIVDADIVGARYRIAASSARLVVLPVTLEDVAASIVVSDGDVFWNRAEARLAGGRLSSFGVSRASGALTARVSAASVAVHELPPIEGKTPGAYLRGLASGSMMFNQADAHGDVVLDEAAFPVIDRARPALDRYGLRPPSEDATGPAVATITLAGGAIRITDIAVALRGAAVRGRVGLDDKRALDGKIEIVLEEEYLRTSKVLTLPRVLGERLVIPVKIAGTTTAPEVHAELGQTLGRFVRESRVGGFVASAVEEAQLLFRSSKMPPSIAPPPPPSTAPTWEATLRAAIDAHTDDWRALLSRR